MIFLLLPLLTFYASLGTCVLMRNPRSLQAQVLAGYLYFSAFSSALNVVRALAPALDTAVWLAPIDLLFSFIVSGTALILAYAVIFFETLVRRFHLIAVAVGLNAVAAVLFLVGVTPTIELTDSIYGYALIPMSVIWSTLAIGFAGILVLAAAIAVRRKRERYLAALLLVALIVGVVLSGLRMGGAQTRQIIAASTFLPTTLLLFYLFLRRQLIDPLRAASDLIVSRLDDALIVTNEQNSIEWLNLHAANVLGVPVETALRQPLAKIVAQSVLSQIAPHVADALQHRDSRHTLTMDIVLDEPDTRVYNLNLTPLSKNETVYTGALLRLSDITDYRSREQRLMAQNAELINTRRQLEAALVEQQQLSITVRGLSLPIAPIADQIIVLSLVGSFDAERGRDLCELLLHGIEIHQARVVLIDTTGVPLVDIVVAQALIDAISAARLIGARVLLVGIRPEIAQTLVSLNIDVRDLVSCATLRDGLNQALAMTGRHIMRSRVMNS